MTDRGKKGSKINFSDIYILIGSNSFMCEYVVDKVIKWSQGMKTFVKFANSEPQVVTVNLPVDFHHKLNPVMKTIPDISYYVQQFGDTMQIKLKVG